MRQRNALSVLTVSSWYKPELLALPLSGESVQSRVDLESATSSSLSVPSGPAESVFRLEGLAPSGSGLAIDLHMPQFRHHGVANTRGPLGICLVSSEAPWLVLPLLDASYHAENSLDGDAVTLFWGSVDGVMSQSGFAKTIRRVIERKKHLVVAHAV